MLRARMTGTHVAATAAFLASNQAVGQVVVQTGQA